MEEDESILSSVSSKLKRRESIFGNEDAISLKDNKIYPPIYKRNLQTEIDLWMHQINLVQQECKSLKSTFNPETKITVNPNISREELDFFDHSLYYEYLRNVDVFCNKIQCAREMQKLKAHVLRKSINRVDKQIKSLHDGKH